MAVAAPAERPCCSFCAGAPPMRGHARALARQAAFSVCVDPALFSSPAIGIGDDDPIRRVGPRSRRVTSSRSGFKRRLEVVMFRRSCRRMIWANSGQAGARHLDKVAPGWWGTATAQASRSLPGSPCAEEAARCSSTGRWDPLPRAVRRCPTTTPRPRRWRQPSGPGWRRGPRPSWPRDAMTCGVPLLRRRLRRSATRRPWQWTRLERRWPQLRPIGTGPHGAWEKLTATRQRRNRQRIEMARQCLHAAGQR
jgi:hypothetical protein